MAKRICQRCQQEKTTANYIASNSPIHGGVLPICRQCLATQIEQEATKHDGLTWDIADKICQWADIPFVPAEWQKIYDGHGKDAIGVYAAMFRETPYNTLEWEDYNNAYLKLQEENRVSDGIAELREANFKKMQKKWGVQYDQQDLEYLENLHQGLLNSQNVVGALNEDQALKLCKISLIIEEKIRGGQDFSKDLKSYDDLAKLSNLTPKNVKDAEEFSSFAEAGAYLEKTGWVAKYYQGAQRDEVDCVQRNIQLWNQRLYVNETGVAEEIEQRINNLKVAAQLEGEEFDEQELRAYIADQSDKDTLADQEEFKIEM